MVNDTRNKHVTTDLQAVFDGSVEEFLEAYLLFLSELSDINHILGVIYSLTCQGAYARVEP